MESFAVAHAFAALGHPARLALFRLLMRFAPRPARPTEIGEALGLPPSTLSHHLTDLANAGLIRVTRSGRSLWYAADLSAFRALVDHMTLDTGRGRPDLIASLLSPEIIQMHDTDFDVLFLCTGNSARSIFAEALLRDLGQGKFQAFSAGIRPGGSLNPFALEVLQRNGHSIEGLRSKNVSEFQAPGAPVMDFVFTVCDTAAAEECPPWAGQPITGHWGMPDPVKVQGTDAEKALAFAQTYGELRRRIAAFVALPFATLDRLSLQRHVDNLSAQQKV
jgi:ArsR family transcriptional regulator, arsenate/arsenite/antimonite-responsive transcriptional repressor / arsenate reductase (thioredoxin)